MGGGLLSRGEIRSIYVIIISVDYERQYETSEEPSTWWNRRISHTCAISNRNPAGPGL